MLHPEVVALSLNIPEAFYYKKGLRSFSGQYLKRELPLYQEAKRGIQASDIYERYLNEKKAIDTLFAELLKKVPSKDLDSLNKLRWETNSVRADLRQLSLLMFLINKKYS